MWLYGCGRGQRGRGAGRGAGPVRAKADPKGRGGEVVRCRCAGSWRQRCSTAGKPLWAPPSPSPSFFSWQRPTSGASYRAQPLSFAYVQPRRAARVGARSRRASRLSASVSLCVWRECEQRESHPTARARVGSYSGLPSSSAPLTVLRCRGSLSPGTPQRVPRALSRYRRARGGAALGGARVLLRGRWRSPLAKTPRSARQQPMGAVAPLDERTGRGPRAGPRSGKRGGLGGAFLVSRSRHGRDQPLQVRAPVTPWGPGRSREPAR